MSEAVTVSGSARLRAAARLCPLLGVARLIVVALFVFSLFVHSIFALCLVATFGGLHCQAVRVLRFHGRKRQALLELLALALRTLGRSAASHQCLELVLAVRADEIEDGHVALG